MQLHHLLKSVSRRKRRIGRGGKRGTYSGRGIKGQKSRAGHSIRPALRDLILRIPKLRGFKNKPVSPKPFIVDLSKLLARLRLESGRKEMPPVINRDTLFALGLLPKRFRGEIKILGRDKSELPLVIQGFKISKGARKAIEAAGGRIES